MLDKMPLASRERFREDELLRLITATLSKQNYELPAQILKYEFLDKGYKIILHGAGLHSERLLRNLTPADKDKIVAISDKNRAGAYLESFLICNPAECLNIDVDFFVLSSDTNQKPLQNELLSHGIDENKIVDLYQNANLANYIMPHRQTNSVSDDINALHNPLTIVSNSMGLNHLKIIKFLAQHFDITILTSSSKIQSLDILDFSDYFNIQLFDSPAKIIDSVAKLDKGCILTINGIYWNSLGAVTTLYSNIPAFALFIDILSSAFESRDELSKFCDADNELLAEEILWRYSSGVIFKEHLDLAKNNIEKYSPKAYIQFADYCDGAVVVERKREYSRDFAFVYAGGLVGDEGDPNFGHHSTILEVAKKINSFGFKFDVFNAYDKTGLEKRYYTSYENELYSYNGALSIFELPHKLCDYDFGVVLFDFAAEGVENIDYYQKGGFSKIMAYIEAEIPIIISKETKFMASLVEKYNIGIAVPWGEISKIQDYLTVENLARWKKNIREVKRKLSYNENIDTLIDFIEACKN